jgi:hypothetical protein
MYRQVEVGAINFKMSSFYPLVLSIFVKLNANPACLEQKAPQHLKARLQEMCGKGQGLGNKVVDHEACFAGILEENGIFSYNADSRDGCFYKYQAQGTQRSIDYRLMEVVSGEVRNTIDIDLKHGEGEGIFLNDGTFLDNVVYIVSFTRILPKIKGLRTHPRQQVCFISLGQNIMSEKSRARLQKRFDLIKKINAEDDNDGDDDLVLYLRNANRFNCKRFTPEFTHEQLTNTITWFQPSS